MAKLVLIFACVALFQIANALDCFHCEGAACEKAQDTWQKTKCSKPADGNSDSACLKQIYKDKSTQKEFTTRKCIIVPKNQKYQCAVPGEEIFCDTCTADFCNSAGGVSLSFAAIAGIVMAMLIPKFLV